MDRHRLERSPKAWPLLLPAAFLLHLAEEWWGGEGLPAWTAHALGREVSSERFLIINGLAWPLFAVLTVLALRRPALAWFHTAFGTLITVNAALHGLGSLVTASYSPGLVTGLIFYFPVGLYALNTTRRQLPPHVFERAVLAGVLIHVVVAVVAFS